VGDEVADLGDCVGDECGDAVWRELSGVGFGKFGDGCFADEDVVKSRAELVAAYPAGSELE
jgi:hypothetical protein